MNSGPPGHAPLQYLPPQYSMPPRAGGGFGRGLIGWILFIGLAAALLLALRNNSAPAATEIPLSDFHRLLREGHVEHVTIEDAEVRGKLKLQLVLGAKGESVLYFRAALPQNVGANWQFTQWVLDNANGARVSADAGGSLLVNIVVPLIPWLLIFGFIWFFVFRQLRMQAVRGQQPAPVYVVNPAGLPGGLGAGPAPAAPVPSATPPQPPGA